MKKYAQTKVACVGVVWCLVFCFHLAIASEAL